MMKKVSGGYSIEISEKELLQSMKFIKDMRDFFPRAKIRRNCPGSKPYANSNRSNDFGLFRRIWR